MKSPNFDLLDGPPSDLVERSVKDLRCMYTFEPFMLFLKATFRAGGSASPAAKSDLINNYNHEEGTHDVSSSKGKELFKLLFVAN